MKLFSSLGDDKDKAVDFLSVTFSVCYGNVLFCGSRSMWSGRYVWKKYVENLQEDLDVIVGIIHDTRI